MPLDIEATGLLYWDQVREYLDELKGRYFSELRGKPDREVWMILGKLELVEELQNLPTTLTLLAQADHELQLRLEKEEEKKDAKALRRNRS